jgi:SOS-response transcriptional repressor LexA
MLKKIICQLRKANNLTQKDVADYLHVQRATYSRYENGTNAVSLDILCKLADLYNVTTDFLLEREADDNNRENVSFMHLYSNADIVHKEIAAAVLKLGQPTIKQDAIKCSNKFIPVVSGYLNDYHQQNESSRFDDELGNDINDGDYAVIAQDDSMRLSGIDKGDYVIIRPQGFANLGDIALVKINERTLLRKVFKQGEIIKLTPSNDNYLIEYYNSSSEMAVIGKAVKVIKSL